MFVFYNMTRAYSRYGVHWRDREQNLMKQRMNFDQKGFLVVYKRKGCQYRTAHKYRHIICPDYLVDIFQALNVISFERQATRNCICACVHTPKFYHVLRYIKLKDAGIQHF